MTIKRILGQLWPFLPAKAFCFLVLFLAGICTSPIVVAQEQAKEEKVYVAAEQMPEFPGGQSAMLKYLTDNFQIKPDFTVDSLSGTMVASFVISKEGKVTQVEVVKKLVPSLDAELVRVISSMPLWKPGKQNGEPVAVRSSVPFRVVWKGIPPKAAVASVLANGNEKESLVINQALEFPGGEKAFWQYMRESNAFLPDARKTGVQGFFVVQFGISETGKVTEVRVIRPLHSSFDKAVVKALKSMPLWQVKEQNGKPRPLSLTFSLGVNPDATDAQDKEQEKLFLTEVVYLNADIEPSFPGGKAALEKFFSATIVYPEGARKAKAEGVFSLFFVLDSQGKAGRLEILEKVHPEVDLAIMEAVKKMPAWRPGKVEGKLVSVRRRLSFQVANNTVTLKDMHEPPKQRYYQPTWEGFADQHQINARLAARQEKNPPAVETMPEFPGGETALWEFMKAHKASLEDAKQMKVAGTFEAEFQISETGQVKDIRITKTLHPDFNKVVVKALEQMPLWKPAQHGGKPVPVLHSFAYEVTEGERRAQVEEVYEEKVYLGVEQRPEFPGGREGFQRYIVKNLVFPAEARQEKVEGTIVLSFIINSKGEVQALQLEQKVHPGVDEALLKVFRQMPAWKPGMLDRSRVSVKLKIPFMVANGTITPVGNW
ncbi:TonB family protein [Sabulibacter ruber]|uniref:TonB family protein n=1 Tax=Sabulibacter ruber TaxID=2811901 RepID=UPI001A9738D9|nr:TonB family protein [Sabulibacter ruber]